MFAWSPFKRFSEPVNSFKSVFYLRKRSDVRVVLIKGLDYRELWVVNREAWLFRRKSRKMALILIELVGPEFRSTIRARCTDMIGWKANFWRLKFSETSIAVWNPCRARVEVLTNEYKFFLKKHCFQHDLDSTGERPVRLAQFTQILSEVFYRSSIERPFGQAEVPSEKHWLHPALIRLIKSINTPADERRSSLR